MAKAQRGFSLIELLIVMVLLAVIVAAIFLQVRTASQRGAFERTQTDLFQESREFMDQMARDLRQAGYPNPRDYDATLLKCTAINGACATNPPTYGDDTSTSAYSAVGLTEADQNHLYFEGGVEDNPTDTNFGKTLFTEYSYDSSTTGNCPCLKRSQMPKVQGEPNDPSVQTTEFTTEVQFVQNYINGNNVPIFTYYTNGGTQPMPDPSFSYAWCEGTSCPLDASGNSANNELAKIDTVRVRLLVQSPYADIKTGLHPVVTLVSTIRINNCSQAASSQRMSCAN